MGIVKPSLRVALRSSPLSLRQFDEWAALFPELDLIPLPMESPGDRDLATSLLHDSPPADFFTRDLDMAVKRGEADAALHSAKDLPWPLDPELAVWALGPCLDARDSLCSRHGYTLDSLPRGARIGTSSPLRSRSLLDQRADVQIVSIRGIIQRRLAHLELPASDPDHLDAVVVATCALRRLGLDAGAILPFATHPLQGHLALTGLLSRRRDAARFARCDVRAGWGLVSIAGAGPGRRDYLSLGVEARLQAADLIVHDALFRQDLLDVFPAEKLYAGKRAGHHAMDQERINEVLAQASREGRRVVRLKAGDPLIFGRGSEEAAWLEERLIPHEILPGISAVQTAAACAGIPLTERARSRSIALVSGFPPESLRLPDTDTMAFYMAGKALHQLEHLSREAGRAKTPLVAVRGAGSPYQQVWRATLGSAGTLPQAGRDDEAILYLGGSTVDQRAGNGWYHREPRILYTGTRTGSGARAIHCPLIRLEYRDPATLDAEERAWLERRRDYAWIVFTSQHSVEHWYRLVRHLGHDSRLLHGLYVASIGQTTSAALGAIGLVPDLTCPPGAEHSQALATLLARESKGRTIFLPRSAQGLPLLPSLLTEAGYTVQEMGLYATLPVDQDPGIDWDQVDILDFASPSTVSALKVFHSTIPDRILVRSRGPQTFGRFASLYPEHPDAREKPKHDPIP